MNETAHDFRQEVSGTRTFIWNALFVLLCGNLVPAAYYVYIRFGNTVPGTRVRMSSLYSDLDISVFLLTMLVCLVFQRRRVSALAGELRQNGSLRKAFWDVLMGMGVGLLIALVFLPIAAKPATDKLFGKALTSALIGFRSPRFVITLIALPICTEIVFREIIMKSLIGRVDRLNVIIVAGSLFAFVWPVFWFWISFALGIATGVLYYERRSVVACIAANTTLTVVLGILLVYKSL